MAPTPAVTSFCNAPQWPRRAWDETVRSTEVSTRRNEAMVRKTIDIDKFKNIIVDPSPPDPLMGKVHPSEPITERLKSRIVGQDGLIDELVRQLARRVRAKRPGRPIAVFCFVGPPGVGKTELAKVLPEVLYDSTEHLHFFSCAEIGKSMRAAGRLFGDRGYVGGEGALTSVLRRIPRAVVLLDEAHHVHPDVWKHFLSAWNDGFVTDEKTGAKSSTTEAIFILTSNAYQREIIALVEAHDCMPDELDDKVRDILSAGEWHLPAEVLSRIDRVFAFRPLKGIDIARVIAMQVNKLAASFGLEIEGGGIDEEIFLGAVEHFEKRGIKGGVRDIARHVERQVTDGLIDAKAAGAKAVRFGIEEAVIKVATA
jgi:ATP-dependent Clp protease ATP-binding subunit ClpA